MNDVSLADYIKRAYVQEEAPLTQTLRINLKTYIDDQFEIIGDPELTMNGDEVIIAVQELNVLVNLTRRIGDLEKSYADYVRYLREEAVEIAEEIDKL